ncbi:hypothetical protein TTHERM_00395860 (macronuclear) [Tetrahymena thermophila SB210]|uniref:Uncharacterized protein n=1 Tax=Tetrahymena thermophila (strain SB210) TaxID=312017 RepID=Q232W7_TETTS|nr:hypothetical protein TTHERM_00395860 [Tetrahymena thermophila SB210]EAR91713.2 hypothetical protein TTHERM_00395860 [Tetrahymena thermophila SB210]|eukprot:XP_001011958.2 hypothetical protein TTHERM_00395860 [Tetrahymena thermophila SB210]
MKQKSFKSLNKSIQDEQSQVISQRDSSLNKIQRSENKSFNRRGRVCLPYKKENNDDNKINADGVLQNLRSNSQPNNQMKSTLQTLKDSQELILNEEADNACAGVVGQQQIVDQDLQFLAAKPAFQSSFGSSVIDSYNNIRPQSIVQNAQILEQDRSFYNKKQTLQNGSQVQENLRYSSVGQTSQIKSPRGFIGFFQQKPLGTQVRSYTTNISTSNTIVPQPTPQISSLNLKSKKLRPQKVVGKKLQSKQNKQTIEDKQSDEDIDDFNEGTNKDIIQCLTQNQIHQLLTAQIENNQSDVMDNNHQTVEHSQKLSSKQHRPPSLHNQKSTSPQNNQNFNGSLSAFEQQKTLQTENDDIDTPCQNQSQIFALDSCKYDSSNGMVSSGLSQNYSNYNGVIYLSKEKANISKEYLEGLQEVIEDDLSTQNQIEQDCLKLQQQKKGYNQVSTIEQLMSNNNNNNIIKNNYMEEKLSSVKQSPKKIRDDYNSFDQMSVAKDFGFQNIKMEQDNENKMELNNRQQTQTLLVQQESSNTNQTEQNQASQNQENNEINVHEINQNELCAEQQQDLVTEPDRQNSPKQSHQAQNSNSNKLQINQKTNISIQNLNNDSNIYGSESTNDPNSVKKRHLTSSQLSQKHFAKYSKSSQDNMKGQQNSLDSNNNSQETVKLQSNSKTLVDFSNYNQRIINKEDDEEPELIEYQKPILNFPLTLSNINQNPQDLVIINNNQKKSQQLQIISDQYQLCDQLNQYENIKQMKSQQDQTQRDSCDKFQSYRDAQLESKILQQTEEKKVRKASLNQGKFVQHKKTNSNIRFSSTIATNNINNNNNNNNLTNSPNFLEQSSFFGDDTLKSATAQNIFNTKHKASRQFFNYDDYQEAYKNQGQIQSIQLNKNNSGQENANYITNVSNAEKENVRQYENNQNTNFQKQSTHLKMNIAKEPTLNVQQSHPTSNSPINNTYFAESNQKVNAKNEAKQANQLQSDQIKINIINNDNNNIENRSNIQETGLKNRLIKNGDNSPSINNNHTDYLSFWLIFKKKADAQRSFTCKQFCQMIWPQTLDRKQRRDKELVLQLYETEFSNENSQHINIFEALSQYYYRFTHGAFYNQMEDKENQSRKIIRANTQYNMSQQKNIDEVRKPSSLMDLFQNHNSSFEITLFSLIHILAFLNNYKDFLDQTNRKVLKKFQLIYLLIKISNIILQKFKQNTFDKSIQILNKNVLDFLNDIFYLIFLDSIQYIIGQEKLETHQINVKLYDKVEQIQLQLTTTEDIIQFFQRNQTIYQKTQQTV